MCPLSNHLTRVKCKMSSSQILRHKPPNMKYVNEVCTQTGHTKSLIKQFIWNSKYKFVATLAAQDLPKADKYLEITRLCSWKSKTPFLDGP